MLVSGIQAAGQTTDYAESKSEKAFQAQELRPGIMMRVEKAADGRLSQVRIERFSGTDSTVRLERTIDADLVKEIIDELVPIAERGAQGEFFGFGFVFGQTWSGDYNYDSVSIRLIGSTDLSKIKDRHANRRPKRKRDNPFESAEVIMIKWKNG